MDYQKLMTEQPYVPYVQKSKKTYVLNPFDRWCNTRKIKDLKKHLDAVYSIAKDQFDLLKLLIEEGFTNSQVSTELRYRGYNNPSTNNYWTPNSVKHMYMKLRS